MRVQRSKRFAAWIRDLVPQAQAGEPAAVRSAKHAYDQIRYLERLPTAPSYDTATLKRVRQSKRYEVWRLSHPYDPLVALRIICWFDPDSEQVVLLLFANDKASMGDVFYDSVGSRADQLIDEWKRSRGRTP